MEIETPVLLVYAIEDSTDIFRISGGFEHPKPPLGTPLTRCNNNLLIYKISSTCFGQSFAHHQERETEIFTAYGNLLWWAGRR